MKLRNLKPGHLFSLAIASIALAALLASAAVFLVTRDRSPTAQASYEAPVTANMVTSLAQVACPGGSASDCDVQGAGTHPSQAATPTPTPTPSPCDMGVSKTASLNPVRAGGILAYTVTVTNSGTGTCSAVMLTDDLPADVSAIGISTTVGSCTVDTTNETVTCSLGDMAASATATVTITVTAPSVSETIINNATVMSSSAESNTVNNMVSLSIQVPGPTPTPTPTATPTPTPSPTPTPGPTEDVPLFADRCTPVSNTFPSPTLTFPTIMGAIDPPRNDDTVWKYFPDENMFRGARRDAPAFANDLVTIDFLDAISICRPALSGETPGSQNGVFHRPRVSSP